MHGAPPGEKRMGHEPEALLVYNQDVQAVLGATTADLIYSKEDEYAAAARAVSVAAELGLPPTTDSIATVQALFQLQGQSSLLDESARVGPQSHDQPKKFISARTGGVFVSETNRAMTVEREREQEMRVSAEAAEEPWQEPHRNLYVANFCDTMGEEQIIELFGAFCEVRRVVMKDVVDRTTGELKGHYCFVWTGGIEQGIAAKNALHNMKINGKKLQVKFAREGAFKITSMTITKDDLGNANRKTVTLRSDTSTPSYGSGLGGGHRGGNISGQQWATQPYAEPWKDQWRHG